MISHSRKAFYQLRNTPLRSRFFSTLSDQNQELTQVKEKLQECEDKVAKLEAKVHSHERANVFIRSFVVSIGTYFFLERYYDLKSSKRLRQAATEEPAELQATYSTPRHR
jgi:hypothetical protein